MEKLLHYVWKHRLYPLNGLHTTDCREVEIIDPGLQNSNAGPDFFNAKVRVDGVMWVGNVELHSRSSDWRLHGHDTDAHYNNVVLHVVEQADCEVSTADGRTLPQIELPVPQKFQQNYEALINKDLLPPCHETVRRLPQLTMHAWMAALAAERMEQRTMQTLERVKLCNGSWEQAFFVALARNFGFGVNGDVFEAWAMSIPLMAVARHRDNPLQVEALFMGQAGLLSEESLPRSHRDEALHDDYFHKLQQEYRFLATKFSLKPIDGHRWRFLRLRPQNFPYLRLSQLASMYCSRRVSLSALADCQTLEEAQRLLTASATQYWRSHYTFGPSSKECDKQLSPQSVQLLIINTVAPVIFAYGRHRGDEQLCLRAQTFLEDLPSEKNHIVRLWQQTGIRAKSAADSQALVELQRQYCDRRDCLRCRFGYEHLKVRTDK